MVACCGEHVLAICVIQDAVYVVHVVQRVLNLVTTGEKLFQFNGTESRRVPRHLLTLLGHNEASHITQKGFRAGRATSLAHIAGEWKSFAFLRYCQADDLSVSALLDVVFEDDHDDEYPGVDGVCGVRRKLSQNKRVVLVVLFSAPLVLLLVWERCRLASVGLVPLTMVGLTHKFGGVVLLVGTCPCYQWAGGSW